MKLDRNKNPSGRGKYALLKLRELGDIHPNEIKMALETLDELSVAQVEQAVDYGDTPTSSFFVIRLKDKYAVPALRAYADAARADDPEYASEIDELVKAANMMPKHIPD